MCELLPSARPATMWKLFILVPESLIANARAVSEFKPLYWRTTV
jgi:hypothetical protein